MKQDIVKNLIKDGTIKPNQKVFVLIRNDDKLENHPWHKETFEINELEVKKIKIECSHSMYLSLFYEIIFDNVTTNDDCILDINLKYEDVLKSMVTYIYNHTEFKNLIEDFKLIASKK